IEGTGPFNKHLLTVLQPDGRFGIAVSCHLKSGKVELIHVIAYQGRAEVPVGQPEFYIFHADARCMMYVHAVGRELSENVHFRIVPVQIGDMTPASLPGGSSSGKGEVQV